MESNHLLNFQIISLLTVTDTKFDVNFVSVYD